MCRIVLVPCKTEIQQFTALTSDGMIFVLATSGHSLFMASAKPNLLTGVIHVDHTT